jgi:hypothetical protein
MIERFLLPEVTSGSDASVDLGCGPVKPRIELSFHILRIPKDHQSMKVIWHDHKITHAISTSVEMHQAIRYDFCQDRFFQPTSSVAAIEFRFPLTVEVVPECIEILLVEFIQLGLPTSMEIDRDAESSFSMMEPCVLLTFPTQEHFFGKRIAGSSGHIDDSPRLAPVRPPSLMDKKFRTRIK